MRLIGLRHGESQFNRLGLCNDDDARQVRLTCLGLSQAQLAADLLRGEAVSLIYSSPLLRARQTAEIVGATLGVDVSVDSRLADIRSGFDGRPVQDYQAAIAADPVDARVNDGESLRDYLSRVGCFLRWLRAGAEGDPARQAVLLVAHEETLRMIDAWCTGHVLNDVVGKPFDNCVPYVFQCASGNWNVASDHSS